MSTDTSEASELRRLLQQAIARAQRAETERDAANEQADRALAMAQSLTKAVEKLMAEFEARERNHPTFNGGL